jgi:hypothetical protein
MAYRGRVSRTASGERTRRRAVLDDAGNQEPGNPPPLDRGIVAGRIEPVARGVRHADGRSPADVTAASCCRRLDTQF